MIHRVFALLALFFAAAAALSECQVATYARNAGFKSNEVPVMVCIAKYESSRNCGATNTNTGKPQLTQLRDASTA